MHGYDHSEEREVLERAKIWYKDCDGGLFCKLGACAELYLKGEMDMEYGPVETMMVFKRKWFLHYSKSEGRMAVVHYSFFFFLVIYLLINYQGCKKLV